MATVNQNKFNHKRMVVCENLPSLMNCLGIFPKNHAADPDKGLTTKSILKLYGLMSQCRQLGGYGEAIF